MTNFSKSELYRKYLIKIQFDNLEGYSVWGTDINDAENDKLLINKNRFLLFSNVSLLVKNAISYQDVFKDEPNFANWLKEED